MAHKEGEWAEYQTPEARLAYSVRLREFAEKMMVEGDMVSAEINLWMAEGYAKPSK